VFCWRIAADCLDAAELWAGIELMHRNHLKCLGALNTGLRKSRQVSQSEPVTEVRFTSPGVAWACCSAKCDRGR